ncbi:hypothetical protein [uncultured Pedobacter sp.]|uniref:hypothetical protein n=1 Tax=uncultured Pedobacter sp. TaxID=246139 RepID=UPI0025F736D7|nr:hypothetical protein [uncultured Pedobacter sp.]
MNRNKNISFVSVLESETFGILASAFILLTIAIYNGSPLTFNADSAMYIEASHRHVIEPDRPILYGLFIRYFSLNLSLWFVIVAQSFIVSYTLSCYFRSFFNNSANTGRVNAKYSNIALILFTALISLCMGASFEVGWLMADIFTPVSILLMGLVIFSKPLKNAKFFAISIMLVLALPMHNSNFYICLTLLLIIGFLYFLTNLRPVFKRAGIAPKRIFIALTLIVASNIALSTIHYLYGGEFKSSRGGIIFLMGNVVEMGIIDQYLNEQCSVKNYQLCKYKDSIPNNFLWDARSPMRKTGGWRGSEKEYKAILKDILTTPRYLKPFISSSIILTLKQFAVFETGEASKPWRRVNMAVRDYHYNDFRNFVSSDQSLEKLDFSIINFIQNIIFGICILLYLIGFGSKEIELKIKGLALFLIIAALINAWVCGTFSGVFPRYQSRVVWLLPLPIFLHLLKLRSNKIFHKI